MKTEFSLKIKMTSTKLMAWYLAVMTWCLAYVVPEEAIAYFVASMSGIIVFLYTGKNIQEYFKQKKDEKKIPMAD